MQAAPKIDPTPHDAETVVANQTAATKVGPPPMAAPSLSELEDLLYDLLASGGDFDFSSELLERIQGFLHEHARQRKTQAQFLAFFEQNKLSTRPERPNLLSLPVLDHASRNAARTPPLLTPTAARQPESPQEHQIPAMAAAIEPRSRLGWAWAALGFGAVSGMLALGVAAVIELRAELTHLNASVARSAMEIEQLRSETERLRKDLQTHANAAVRTEHNTDLLLESLVSPLMRNSR